MGKAVAYASPDGWSRRLLRGIEWLADLGGGGTVELERRASAQGMLAHLGFPEDWAAQMDYAGGGRVVFATRRR